MYVDREMFNNLRGLINIKINIRGKIRVNIRGKYQR